MLNSAKKNDLYSFTPDHAEYNTKHICRYTIHLFTCRHVPTQQTVLASWTKPTHVGITPWHGELISLRLLFVHSVERKILTHNNLYPIVLKF